jgi:phosphate starvation-inducible PhoH-like protein
MKRNKRYSEGSESQSNGIFLRPLQAKNDIQKFYLDTMREATITFGLGPAGTGKTFLAVYVALEKLLNREVDKIVLTRPIVAVEDIGYLPGTMDEKIHPYVLPLLDALEIHIGTVKTKELIEKGAIEVNPLAYMRGRSLNRSIVILDEAQNTTREQMKMFLTRLGYETQFIITGDASQSDIPNPKDNGLAWAAGKLIGKDPSIAAIEFAHKNIVRNPLIATMLKHLEAESKPKQYEQPVSTMEVGTLDRLGVPRGSGAHRTNAALLSSNRETTFASLPDEKGFE